MDRVRGGQWPSELAGGRFGVDEGALLERGARGGYFSIHSDWSSFSV